MRKRPISGDEVNSCSPQSAYLGLHGGIVELEDSARRAAARNVNSLMTASYWEIGRRIVEAEQGGRRRAAYGQQLIARLAVDLTAKFGRGFSADNLENRRRFFSAHPLTEISETVSRKLTIEHLAQLFTLPWSAYVRLLSVKDADARLFYETEALRGGWSVRQLDRQIGSQFYQRTMLSRDKASMLRKGTIAKLGECPSADEAIRVPTCWNSWISKMSFPNRSLKMA